MAEKPVKPKVNVEQPPDTENQNNEANEETFFFHPIQISDEGGEVLSEEQIEKSRVEVEQKLQELLKTISEETLQLSEFLMEENNLVQELHASLKQILKKLNVSFNIPPKNLPLKRQVKKVILNEECHLIIVHEKGEVNSASLAEYPPEIIMAVLLAIMPELAKVVMLYRKKISTRVNFFGKVKKELKNVVKAIVGGKEIEESAEEGQIMDAVKEAVTEDGSQG
ncbi:MAG: hypothetical protein QW386_05665 [Candidatus Bathyarchaeia archaeon]